MNASLAYASPEVSPFAGLLRAFDDLHDAVGIYDDVGGLVWANRSFQSLSGASPGSPGDLHSAIAEAIGRARRGAHSAGPHTRPEPLTSAGYQLRATRLDGFPLAAGALSVVVIQSAPRTAPSDDHLRLRHGLSQQEMRVARLLATGASNGEISRALCISPHTARHHTERVLAKLEVRSRAAVAARISGT